MNTSFQTNMIDRALIDNMSGMLGWKDLDSRYLGLNKWGCGMLGFRSEEKCLGVTDYDLPCSASKNAAIFIDQDNKTLQRGPQTNIDICYYADGQPHVFLAKKSLLLVGGVANGTIFNSIEMDHGLLSQITYLLFKDKRLVDNQLQQASFNVGGDFQSYGLSERESECLFYLLRGKTSQNIANILGLSRRTVETYIINMRNKLGVDSVRDLIEFGVESGLVFALPRSILNQRGGCHLSI